MALIQIDPRTTTVAEPVIHRARLSVPRGLVPMVKTPEGDQTYRTYNGDRINDMLALWPYDELRTRCIDGVKQWVRRRALDGDELLTAEADVKVFGPYRSRAGTYSGTKRRVDITAYAEDEDFNEDLADFVFEAQFLTRRHRPVQTKDEA